jgi:hypothetical protein
MTRAIALAALLALPLAGCDAGRRPFAEAGRAEAEGRFDDAIARYAAVCSKAPASPLCARAEARADRLVVRQAITAIADKRFGQAKPWLDTAAGSKDPVAREAAAQVAASPDFVQGLAWMEAAAIEDHRQALPKMEALASADVTSSADARAWVEKNRPAIMLEDVQAACVPAPPEHASCVATGRKLAALYPRSPEAAAARKLVEAEYRRMVPVLREAETVLMRAVPIGRGSAKVERCMQQMPENAAPHASSMREICEGEGFDPQLTSDVQTSWLEVTAQIRDPEIFRVLTDRWDRVMSEGIYEPRFWPPPAPDRP